MAAITGGQSLTQARVVRMDLGGQSIMQARVNRTIKTGAEVSGGPGGGSSTPAPTSGQIWPRKQ